MIDPMISPVMTRRLKQIESLKNYEATTLQSIMNANSVRIVFGIAMRTGSSMHDSNNTPQPI